MKRLAVETRPKSIRGGLAMILFLTAAMLASNIFMGTAVAQMRIVVLPFYTEKGLDAKDGGRDSLHYRRMMRFINNQLVRHGFDVINPFAKDASEREYNRVMERAREDSSLACLEVCKKYGVDAAYVVWLKVKRKTTPDGYCKVSARVDGEGYDSGGRDLGASVSKSYKLARSDCDDAIADVEKEVGDVVGRALTAWSGDSGRSSGSVVVSGGSGAGESSGGGILQRNLEKTQNRLEVRLDGASEYELVEVFGKVLNTATGVLDTKRLNMNIQPDTPQACYSTWRANIEDTDPFRLQANIMKMINDILDAGPGDITLRGVPYRYTAPELDLLKGIRPGSATTRSIQFVIDRERARDKEFQDRHDPYKTKKKKASPGFE